MKRYLLSLLTAFALSSVATAQNTFTAGDISLGMNASVVSDLNKSNAFSIGLSGGWHFNERWEAGVSLGYAHKRDNLLMGSDNLVTLQKDFKGIVASLYVTWYLSIAPGFYFDLRGMTAFRFDSYVAQPVLSLSSAAANVRENGVGIMVSPGLTYLINRRLQLGMSLGGLSWNMSKAKGDTSYGSKNSDSIALDWNNGVSVALGFRF